MTILTRVVLWALCCCFPVGAVAQERQRPVEIGVGLICNSQEQVERYLALHVADRSPDAAIKAVNDEVKDPNACALAAIAFMRGSEAKQVPAPGGLMRITPVVIFATQTEAGWERIVPIVQYTAIFEKLTEA